MRVNFLIIRPLVDGGARIIASHAKYLKDAGHEASLFALGADTISLREQFRLLKQGKWRSRAPIDPKIYEDAGLQLTIFQNANTITPDDIPNADVTIATWWETVEWLGMMPPEKGAKVHFVQGHEAVLPHGQATRAHAVHLLPTRKIAVSRWLQNVLKREYKIDDAIVVENGVNTHRFNTPVRTKQSRPTVGFVYSGARLKNAPLAIAACEALRKSFDDLRVLAFGRVNPSDQTTLPDWLEFHSSPAQDAIPNLYAACDVWLFTSIEEGFGLPILEALACRTPVVATPAGAAPEIITEACGALIEPDCESVATAAARILSMKNGEWQKASDAARARSETFSAERSGAAFEQALKEIVAGDRR